MKPETDDQFAIAANHMASAFLDKFAKLALSPDEVANLCGAALGTIMANQLGPFGAVKRLRLIADEMEKQVLDDALSS